MDQLKRLKNARARCLGTLTSTRRRALVVVNARGSRSELISILKELDTALDGVTGAHHDYLEVLVDGEQKEAADKTFAEAGAAHESTVDRISAYLEERKGDPASDASVSAARHSGASTSSQATREAEIQVRLKQLKLEQLNQQLSQEKAEEELKQKQLREQHDLE